MTRAEQINERLTEIQAVAVYFALTDAVRRERIALIAEAEAIRAAEQPCACDICESRKPAA